MSEFFTLRARRSYKLHVLLTRGARDGLRTPKPQLTGDEGLLGQDENTIVVGPLGLLIWGVGQ